MKYKVEADTPSVEVSIKDNEGEIFIHFLAEGNNGISSVTVFDKDNDPVIEDFTFSTAEYLREWVKDVKARLDILEKEGLKYLPPAKPRAKPKAKKK